MADEKQTQKKTKEKPEDFKYIVRIANTDVDGEKAAVTALAGIKGIGSRIPDIVIRKVGYPPNKKLGLISDEDAAKIEEVLLDLPSHVPDWLLNRQKDWASGEYIHLLSTELEMGLRDDINRLRMIRCYRGVRHETGQKVRGQRTRSNGRTGLTLGVSRKKGVN